MLGKTEGKRRSGRQRTRGFDSMDMNMSKLWGRVKDREAWGAAVHGVTKWHDLVTEQRRTPELQVVLISRKSIKITYHINKGQKPHYHFSTCFKMTGQNSILFHHKTTQKLWIEGNFSTLKRISENPMANIMLNNERLKSSDQKQGCSFSLFLSVALGPN